MPNTSQSTAKAKKSVASTKVSNGMRGGAGRPAAKAFINVQVKLSTRKALNQLKSITGLKTQGDVLDRVIADFMRQQKQG